MTSNNPFLRVFSLIDKFISENIIDINSTRSNKTDPKQRRWLYPEYPEKNDEDYPRLTLQFEGPKSEDIAANNYLSSDLDSNGYNVSDTHGFLYTIPVSLTLFIRKDQVHYITYNDGTVHPVKNIKQADILSGEIVAKLKENYSTFALNGITLGKDITSTGAYQDNDSLWAVDISFDVQLTSEYCIKFPESNIIKYITDEVTITT